MKPIFWAYDGEIVSSTRIRKALEQGDLKQANKLLGNPYTIFGTVVHGKELGRTLGMPTVNLIPSKQKLLPSFRKSSGSIVAISSVNGNEIITSGFSLEINKRRN